MKEKITGKTLNNFTIIKSITIIIVYVIRLKKNLSYFSLLSHTLIISLKGGNTLLSPFYFLLRAQLSLDCLLFSKRFTLSYSLFFFLCGFLFLCSCTYSPYVFSKTAAIYSLLSLGFLPSENPFYFLLVS